MMIDPSKFKSKFGLWLAESVATTDRDDDLSNIWITHRDTTWDRYAAQFAERLRSIRPDDAAGIEAALAEVEAWARRQREILGMYGDTLLKCPRQPFAWPVLGSRASDGIELEAEAYFDLCAARIRALRPLAVTDYRHVDVPESLNVCIPRRRDPSSAAPASASTSPAA
jgi:hypothetical protein